MKSKSRQGRIEATQRANRIKAQTKTSFDADHGQWKPDKPPTDFLKCNCLGHQINLRFGYVWTAYCPDFDIEVEFTNRPDSDKMIFLSSWLQAHIDQPQASSAKLRQSTPAVLYLAERYEIETPLADEITRGR